MLAVLRWDSIFISFSDIRCGMRVLRCLHCSEEVDITTACTRGNKYSCKLCNGARIALQNHHRETGQWKKWSAMSRVEKDNLIANNKHRSLGKGNKFPVKCEEKADLPHAPAPKS